jgi:hypothetical protein
VKATKKAELSLERDGRERTTQIRALDPNGGTRMAILHEIINLLMIVNIGGALLAWVAAARHQVLIMWEWMEQPDWSWWSPGNVFSSSLPEKYWSRRRQLAVLIVAFLASLAAYAVLSWLYGLTAPGSASC